ncbi:hypothetical protein [Luteipulveratus halotolerans]|nr:hypothetical protein [Luteipulveratus halotolerans]
MSTPTVDLPTSLGYGKVVFRALVAETDGPDEGSLPACNAWGG